MAQIEKVDLTKAVIEKALPTAKEYRLYDSKTRGLFLRVLPSGIKSFLFSYRRKGDGRQRFLTLGRFPDMAVKEAREQAGKERAKVDDGLDPAEVRAARLDDLREEYTIPTLAEFGKRYLEEHATPHKKESSVHEDTRILEKVILPKLGKKRLDQITRGDVQALIHHVGAVKVDRRFNDAEQARKGSPILANRTLALLKTIFSCAERWGVLKEGGVNPCRFVNRFKETSRRRYMSPDELKRLATAMNEMDAEQSLFPGMTTAVRLLLLTGCRSSEILGLKWAHVDLGRQCLELPDSKTGAKTVSLNRAACELLDGLKRDPSGWVLPGRRNGKPIDNLKPSWKVICEKAEIDGLRIHDLRHSFASVGAGLGLGLPIIGALLGHRQAQTTLRYSHLQTDPLQAAANAIGDAITSAMTGARIIDVQKPVGQAEPSDVSTQGGA